MKIIKKMILAASVLAVSVANAATDMNIKYMGQGHSILTRRERLNTCFCRLRKPAVKAAYQFMRIIKLRKI